MIKLRDLLCCCGGGNEVYIMGDSTPELILPPPIRKSKTYLNEELLDRGVRNISAYNGHLHVRLSEKRIQDVVDSRLKEMEDEKDE